MSTSPYFACFFYTLTGMPGDPSKHSKHLCISQFIAVHLQCWEVRFISPTGKLSLRKRSPGKAEVALGPILALLLFLHGSIHGTNYSPLCLLKQWPQNSRQWFCMASISYLLSCPAGSEMAIQWRTHLEVSLREGTAKRKSIGGEAGLRSEAERLFRVFPRLQGGREKARVLAWTWQLENKQWASLTLHELGLVLLLLSLFGQVLSDSFETPGTVILQGPLSMEFSRQEYWGGLPFPSSGDVPEPGTEPASPTLQADSLPTELPGKPLVLL